MAHDPARIDRSAFSITSFDEVEARDRAYWLALNPQARLEALEMMRQINYGYDATADRIQRTVEIAQRA
ncbi:MAG: hypothetical protein AAGI71_13955 [Bacteroidota bacterium]